MSEQMLPEFEALKLMEAMKGHCFASVDDCMGFVQGWMDAAAARRKDRDQWMVEKIARIGGQA